MEYDVFIGFGTKRYYKKGTNIFHRTDGPAIELPDGTKQWWLDGELHRTDGPALEYPNGNRLWIINGKRLSPEKEAILNQWWDNKNGV